MGKYYWKAIALVLGGLGIGFGAGWWAKAPNKDAQALLSSKGIDPKTLKPKVAA